MGYNLVHRIMLWNSISSSIKFFVAHGPILNFVRLYKIIVIDTWLSFIQFLISRWKQNDKYT